MLNFSVREIFGCRTSGVWLGSVSPPHLCLSPAAQKVSWNRLFCLVTSLQLLVHRRGFKHFRVVQKERVLVRYRLLAKFQTQYLLSKSFHRPKTFAPGFYATNLPISQTTANHSYYQCEWKWVVVPNQFNTDHVLEVSTAFL